MTTKETLYLDDALAHAQVMAAQCREAANTLTDPELRRQAQQLAEGHSRVYTSSTTLSEEERRWDDKSIMENLLKLHQGHVRPLYARGHRVPHAQRREAFCSALNTSTRSRVRRASTAR